MGLPNNVLADVKQTPRGSVVVLGDRVLTDEMETEDAYTYAIALNWRLLDENQTRIIQC